MRLLLICLPVAMTLLGCNSDDINGPATGGPDGGGDIFSKFTILNDEIQGESIVVAGNRSLDLIVSYSRHLEDGTILEAIEIDGSNFPMIFKDMEGNSWDIWGTAISGPRVGQTLNKLNSLTSYWFAVAAIYPGVDIYGEESIPDNPNQTNDDDWLIPSTFIFQGSGRDLIASIDNPKFDLFRGRSFIESYPYLKPNEFVTVIESGSETRVYPHSILSYHEIVNDVLENGEKVSILHCPLVGSSSVWERTIDNEEVTFGVSGLLYNNDLLAFDRTSNSRWLQISGECVNGPNQGKIAKKIKHFETTWGSVAKIYASSSVLVLSTDTDQDYDYSVFPYTGYRENNDQIPFPLTFSDNRLLRKERVHAIISDNTSAKVYRLEDF